MGTVYGIISNFENDTYTLSVNEYNLSARSKAPSNKICRQLKELDVEGSLEVYDHTGSLRYTITNIIKWADKQLAEDDYGLKIKKYVPFLKWQK